eukprot:g999.t1
MSSNAKLAVLKRIDAGVTDIVASAGHVVMYLFDEQAKQWTRKGVEGPLFVAKRAEAPHFRLVVLNRLSTENVVQDLTVQFQFEQMDPYLIYRTNEDAQQTTKVINGIWIHAPEERQALAKKLRTMVKALRRVAAATTAAAGGRVPRDRAASQPTPAQQQAPPQAQPSSGASQAPPPPGMPPSAGAAAAAGDPQQRVGDCTRAQLTAAIDRAVEARMAQLRGEVRGMVGELRKRQQADAAQWAAAFAKQQQQLDQLKALVQQQQR